MGLPDDFDFDAFVDAIDQDPQMRGTRVVFFDGYDLTVVREGPPYCAVGLQAIVIRVAVEQTVLQTAPAAEARDSRIFEEILGLGLSCSAATIGWLVVAGSTGAAPLTGGSSVFLAYLSLAAATASSIQCLNAAGRVGAEAYAPEMLDVLDREVWYQKTSWVLDAISLAGAIASTAVTIRLALSLHRTTGKALTEVLRGLSRQQRKQLAEEAVRIRNPGISQRELKLLVRAGVYPSRFSGAAVNRAVQTQLKDATGAALSFAGSVASGVVRDSAKYVVGVARSVETYP